MELIPLKTPLIKANDELMNIIELALSKKKERLKNKDILVITSKIVSYAQNRLMPVAHKEKLEELVNEEADKVYGEGKMKITLTEGILCPNAGIDNSNVPEGLVVLWPKDPFKTARQLQFQLKQKYHLKNLGIVFSDSICHPLRRGTSGIALGWAGFEGVIDERGKRDLFNQKMQYTEQAMADSLASAANLLMGETNASTPMVIARNAPVTWNDKKASKEDYYIDPDRCIYKDVMNY